VTIEEQKLLHYDGARASLVTLAGYAGEFDERALVEHLRVGELARRAWREAGGDAGMVFSTWARLAIHAPMASIERFQIARRELQHAAVQAREDAQIASEGLRQIDERLAAMPPSRLLDPNHALADLQYRARNLRVLAKESNETLLALRDREEDDAAVDELIARARGLAAYVPVALNIFAEEVTRRAKPAAERLAGSAGDLLRLLSDFDALVTRAETIASEPIAAPAIQYAGREALRTLFNASAIVELIPAVRTPREAVGT